MKEIGTSGVYQVFRGSNRDTILITDDNRGKIKVTETKAPPGYSNIDPATGQPYTWEYTFPKDGGTVTFTIDAKNTGLPVGFSVVKKGTDGPLLSGAEFTLYSDEACTAIAKDLNNKSVFASGSDGKNYEDLLSWVNAHTGVAFP